MEIKVYMILSALPKINNTQAILLPFILNINNKKKGNPGLRKKSPINLFELQIQRTLVLGVAKSK